MKSVHDHLHGAGWEKHGEGDVTFDREHKSNGKYTHPNHPDHVIHTDHKGQWVHHELRPGNKHVPSDFVKAGKSPVTLKRHLRAIHDRDVRKNTPRDTDYEIQGRPVVKSSGPEGAKYDSESRAQKNRGKFRVVDEMVGSIERDSNREHASADGHQSGPDPRVQRELKNHGILYRAAKLKARLEAKRKR